MTSILTRRFTRLLPILLILFVAVPARAQVTVPSPTQFFGFPMGAEEKLAGWDEIVGYFQAVDKASPRILVQELGRTTLGKPYIMAIVSTPDTIANLGAYQEMQRKLADPRKTPQAEAERIAREGKAVLLVGTNVHSTEIGNSQMVNQLLYQMATENSPWMDHVLKNVILLLIPSQNPDGQQMVVDWYRRNVGTPYVDSPLPELYHKYAGHDNNRDSYMLTQVETRLLNRVTYKDWLPEVYLDKHQMGSNRARIFVPPFKNPPNPNIDPLVWSEVNILGQSMAAKLQEHGKTGVIWGEMYSGYWQGGNSTNPWWHNMVALLTEVASARLATTIEQEEVDPERGIVSSRSRGMGFGDRDVNLPLPAPGDLQYRMNYPEPWLGGSWRLADVVEYQLLSTLGLLEGVANNKITLKRNFYGMNRRAIDRFAEGSPYGYIVPTEQRDPIVAAKLLQLLQAEAAEVHRASAPFVADGTTYPAGTHVVLLSQPFGRWVKDMLEPQKYPDIRWPNPGAPLDRPYNVTAWTLGMLMNVETVLVQKPFTANLSLLTRDAEAPAGKLNGTGPTYVLNHEVNQSFVAMNRLLKEGAEVSWAPGELKTPARVYSPGAILIRGATPGAMSRLAQELRLQIDSLQNMTDAERGLPIRLPRIAVFEPWGGNMDAGWTRWVLEQHEFPFTRVRGAELRESNLLSRFDVIIFGEMTSGQIVRGLQGSSVLPEHRGGIGEDGIRNLKDFVREGGTVVTLGNAAQFAIDSLEAPFENILVGVDQDSFFCPGSLLRVEVDVKHPVGYGMPNVADAMFIQNGAYTPTQPLPATAMSTIARYPGDTLIRSGWIIGESRLHGAGAVLEAIMGKGRIIMHTFRVQNRGQTLGTFKLLFNSLYYGPAMMGRPAVDTMEFIQNNKN